MSRSPRMNRSSRYPSRHVRVVYSPVAPTGGPGCRGRPRGHRCVQRPGTCSAGPAPSARPAIPPQPRARRARRRAREPDARLDLGFEEPKQSNRRTALGVGRGRPRAGRSGPGRLLGEVDPLQPEAGASTSAGVGRLRGAAKSRLSLLRRSARARPDERGAAIDLRPERSSRRAPRPPARPWRRRCGSDTRLR